MKRSFLLTTLLTTSVAFPSKLKCDTNYVGSTKMGGTWTVDNQVILAVDAGKITVTANIPSGATGAVAWATGGVELEYVRLSTSNADQGSMVANCKTAWYSGTGSAVIDMAGASTAFRVTPGATAGKLYVGYGTGKGPVKYNSIDIEAAADCLDGSTYNANTGKAPCSECGTCGSEGVKNACTKTANTVCNEVDCVDGSTYNANTGKAPCNACGTCGSEGVKNVCTKTANTVCNEAECVAGKTFNAATGRAPCTTCNACSANGIMNSCTKTADAVCNSAVAADCVNGSTWNAATGKTPCAMCKDCAVTGESVQSMCTKTANTVCTSEVSAGSAATSTTVLLVATVIVLLQLA